MPGAIAHRAFVFVEGTLQLLDGLIAAVVVLVAVLLMLASTLASKDRDNGR